MVNGIIRELDYQKDFFEGLPIQTIYFGGGTPSMLASDQLQKILKTVISNYPLKSESEITLEANPDDISIQKLIDWKSLGINRLSIGVQSFRDEDLQWMNRNHRSKDAKEALELAVKSGFENLSLDLIYALPGLSDEDWVINIQQAFELGITHLSCYSLTVEEKTKLKHLIKQGQMPGEDDDQSARQFELLIRESERKGFEHYEISNFAKPRFRSKHNLGYWNREPYLGIGPSAHSFRNQTRRWNISSNAAYLQSIGVGKPENETEQLSRENIANEIIMTGLRTKEGFALQSIRSFNFQTFKTWMNQVNMHEKSGMLRLIDGQVQLSHKGKFYADDIASDLFF